MKKILCTLLVLAMVLSCVSMVSFAMPETSPEAETIWTMDFEDATAVGYAPNSQTGDVSNAGVIDSGDTHGKVYSWTAGNGYGSKGWTLTPYIQAFAAKNPDKNIVLTVTADAKLGDEVSTKKNAARFGFRSPVGTNNDANVYFDTTPYIQDYGTWNTLTGTKTIKASEIATLTNNYYRLFFDSIQGTFPVNVYLDNITVTAKVAPDATKVTFTAATNSIATASGAVTNEVAAFIEANGSTGTFKKTYRVYSTAAASKSIQLQFQATVGGSWVGTSPSTNITKTVAPYTWTEFEVPLSLTDGQFVTSNGATAYSNAFLRINANSAEVGASLYVVDVTNPDWAVTGSQYNSGKATFTRAYSSGVPTPEAVEFTAVPAGTANRTYYARNGAIGTEVKNLVASDFTGKKTFTFKIYNTGTVDLPAVYVYFQGGSNGWASITGTSAVKANVPAGKYAYATFTLRFLNGNVVDASDTVQPYDKLSLRVETQNASSIGTVYDGAKFAVVPVELSLSAIGNVTNTAAFTTKMLLDDLSGYQLAKKEITNGNAEAGVTSNWAAFASGGGTLSTAEGANGTATSIKFVPNNTAYASIAYDLGPAIIQDEINLYDGGGAGYYRVSFYAKADSGKSGTFTPMINSQHHIGQNTAYGTTGYTTLAGVNTWVSAWPAVTMTDEWQQFTFTVNLSENFITNIMNLKAYGSDTAYFLGLRLDGSQGAFKTERFTYYIDELTIEKFTPTATPSPVPTATPEPTRVAYKYTVNEYQTGTTAFDPATKYQIMTNAGGGYLTGDADLVTDGTITRTYKFYNLSDHTLNVMLSLNAITKKDADNKDTWSGPKSGTSNTIAIPAGKYYTYTVSLTVADGLVAIPNCAARALTSFFFRIDISGLVGNDEFAIATTNGKHPTGVGNVKSIAYLYELPAGEEYTTPVPATATPAPTATPTPAPTATPTPAPTATPNILGVNVSIATTSPAYFFRKLVGTAVQNYITSTYGANYTGNVRFSFDVYNTGDTAFGLYVYPQAVNGWTSFEMPVVTEKTLNLQPGQKDTIAFTVKVINGSIVNSKDDTALAYNQISIRFESISATGATGSNITFPGANFTIVANELAQSNLLGFSGFTYGEDVLTLPDYATPTPKPTPTPTPNPGAEAGDKVAKVVWANGDAALKPEESASLVAMINDAGIFGGLADGDYTFTYKVYNPSNEFIIGSVGLHTTLSYTAVKDGVADKKATNTWTGITSEVLRVAPKSYQTYDLSFTIENGKITISQYYIGTDEGGKPVRQNFSYNASAYFLRLDFRGIATGEAFYVGVEGLKDGEPMTDTYKYLPWKKLNNVYKTAENQNQVNTVTYETTDIFANKYPTVIITDTAGTGTLKVVSGAYAKNANQFYARQGSVLLQYTGDDADGTFIGLSDGTTNYDVRTNNTVYINVGSDDISLTLRRAAKAGDTEKVVTFNGASGAMVSSNTYDSTAFIAPTATTRLGMDFTGYKLNGVTYADSEALKTAIDALPDGQSVVVSMVYTAKSTKYNVNVSSDETGATLTINGTVAATDAFEAFQFVKVVASDVDGKKFAYWTDEDGNVLSTRQDYSFYVLAHDVELKAVYVDNDAEVPVTNYIAITTIQKNDDGSLTMVSERAIDSRVTLTANGIMFLESTDDSLDADALETAFTAIYNGTFEADATNTKGQKVASKYTNALGSFILTKKTTVEDRTYYACAYICYTDANGVEHVQLSDANGLEHGIVQIDSSVID